MELRRQGTMRVIEAALICEIRLPHAKVMNIPHYLNICYNNEEEKKLHEFVTILIIGMNEQSYEYL